MLIQNQNVEMVSSEPAEISKEFVITAMNLPEENAPKTVEVRKKKKLMQKLDASKMKNPTLSWQHRSDQMTLCIDKLDKNAKFGYEMPEKDHYMTHNTRTYKNLQDHQEQMMNQTYNAVKKQKRPHIQSTSLVNAP